MNIYKCKTPCDSWLGCHTYVPDIKEIDGFLERIEELIELAETAAPIKYPGLYEVAKDKLQEIKLIAQATQRYLQATRGRVEKIDDMSEDK